MPAESLRIPHGPIAVLGFGNMGEAIVGALLRSGTASAPSQLLAYDPDVARRAAAVDLPRLTWCSSPSEAVRSSQIVLLAVKPQTMPSLLQEIAGAAADRLVVSIAAGITTAFIEARLPHARVVRCMPNTPLLAGKGVVGLCRGLSASEQDLSVAESLFPGAMCFGTDESLMDAVTAVSGSGPAYLFAFVEALAAAAQAQGFDAETSYQLAARTFTGAAALLETTGATASELRRRVTSPGGTTQAALEVFASRDLEGIVRAAVDAATRRGRDLSAG